MESKFVQNPKWNPDFNTNPDIELRFLIQKWKWTPDFNTKQDTEP